MAEKEYIFNFKISVILSKGQRMILTFGDLMSHVLI